MNKNLILTLIAIMLACMLQGCSQSDNTVTYPGSSENLYLKDNLKIAISDYSIDGSPYAGMGALGLFQVNIDSNNLTGEITSLRKTALPDVLEVTEISNFLQMSPCTDCAKLQSVALNEEGNLVVSIGLKHPFEEGDPFKPITGRNRGDLHVFNIEGIVISNSPATNFSGLGRRIADFRLLNASGYTGYLDPMIDQFYPTDADIHPYILHFDDYSSGNFDPNNPMGFASVTNPPPSGNLVMAMGSDYDFKDYIFDVDGSMDFIFAIGCTYAVSSARKMDRFNPEYRVPQHNKKAASEVWVDIVENNLTGEVTESSAILQVNVVDINHGVPVGDALNEMLADSSVSGLTVEVPGVTLTSVSFSTDPISGTGHDPSDPLIYEGEITNSVGGTEGSYLGLVKVTDSYQPGLNTSPLLDGMDGIERVDPVINPLEGLFAIPEFATYQTFQIDVATACIPPVVTRIVPSSMVLNPGIYTDVTIQGEHFAGSGGVTQVYIDNSEMQIYATNIEVIDDTELRCDFDVSSADEDTYDVVVITACEGRGENLLNISGWPQEWAMFQYSTNNIGQNMNPQNIDPNNLTQKWYTPISGFFKVTGPVVTENYAYVMANNAFYSNSTNHQIAAFDMDTGAIAWQKYVNPSSKEGRAHTGPVWYDDGENGRVISGGDRVWCFDAVTGNVIWEYGFDDYVFIRAAPKVYNDRIYIAGSGMIHCLDVMNGNQIWTSDSGVAGSESIPAIDGDRLYVGNWGGSFFCIDINDGSTVWNNPNAYQQSHWDAPLVINDRVYYASYHQRLVCLDAQNGNIIWTYTESTSSAWITALTYWIDPSDDNVVIYFGAAFSNGGIWAIKDLGSTPMRLWRSHQFYCDASPVFNDGVIYVGDTYNNHLYGFDAATGDEIMRQSLNSGLRAAVGIAFDKMIVPAGNGIYCFE